MNLRRMSYGVYIIIIIRWHVYLIFNYSTMSKKCHQLNSSFINNKSYFFFTLYEAFRISELVVIILH